MDGWIHLLSSLPFRAMLNLAHRQMDGWVDGWKMDTWMGGWVGEWLAEWMEGWVGD